jgi:hypothetical protein
LGIPDPFVRSTGPWILIRTNMPEIPNTGFGIDICSNAIVPYGTVRTIILKSIIIFQLAGFIADDEYMAFGLSGKQVSNPKLNYLMFYVNNVARIRICRAC